jgi:hypothetical protein
LVQNVVLDVHHWYKLAPQLTHILGHTVEDHFVEKPSLFGDFTHSFFSLSFSFHSPLNPSSGNDLASDGGVGGKLGEHRQVVAARVCTYSRRAAVEGQACAPSTCLASEEERAAIVEPTGWRSAIVADVISEE